MNKLIYLLIEVLEFNKKKDEYFFNKIVNSVNIQIIVFMKRINDTSIGNYGVHIKEERQYIKAHLHIDEAILYLEEKFEHEIRKHKIKKNIKWIN